MGNDSYTSDYGRANVGSLIMGDKVYIGCKLHSGIILEVNGKSVTLNGVTSSKEQDFVTFTPFSGAVGLTLVDKDFWEAWVKQYPEFPAYKNGLIFASNKEKKVVDEAKEKATLKSGTERMTDNDLPSNIKRVQPGAS